MWAMLHVWELNVGRILLSLKRGDCNVWLDVEQGPYGRHATCTVRNWASSSAVFKLLALRLRLKLGEALHSKSVLFGVCRNEIKILKCKFYIKNIYIFRHIYEKQNFLLLVSYTENKIRGADYAQKWIGETEIEVYKKLYLPIFTVNETICA